LWASKGSFITTGQPTPGFGQYCRKWHVAGKGQFNASSGAIEHIGGALRCQQKGLALTTPIVRQLQREWTQASCSDCPISIAANPDKIGDADRKFAWNVDVCLNMERIEP